MSTTAQLIEELAAAGIRIWNDGGKLRYRGPSGVMTPELLADMKQRRDEILQELDIDDHIPAIPDQPDYEISHAQRRLWILSNIEQGSSAYNIPLHQILEGNLDPIALRRAFEGLVVRHESLRTTFEIRDDEPRQIVHPPGLVALDCLDFTLSGREAALEAARRDSTQPFDLSRCPLFRVKLMRTGPAEHILSITLHHLICDGISIAVLAGELGSLYRAHAAGIFPSLPPLRIQYRDFARWHNRSLDAPSAAVNREYWRSKLSAPYPVLDLPLDQPRPREQSFEGREISISLPKDRFHPLVQLAQSTGSSLFVVLVAMVKTLLRRYTGMDDIVVGSPFAGHHHQDLEGQIGFYINILPLRDKVSGSISFRDLIRQVRGTVSEAFGSQSWPFDLMVSDAAIPRDLSRSPLFDVAVILQSQRDDALTMPGLRTQSCFEHPGTSKFDLTFYFKEVSDHLVVSIEYATALFSAARMERMMRHLEQLAASVGQNADTAVDALEILPAQERRFVVPSKSASAQTPDGPAFLCRFENQAAQTPDRLAVVAGNGSSSVTYGELNRRAEHVAAFLQSRGVRPDNLVAVMLPRTPDLLVGLLGVLKAGAAYVPLDPSMPAARMQAILDDAQPGFHLRTESVAEACDSPLEFRPPRVFAENLSYVIYTSGSTGRPKGVAITHRSLNNFLNSMLRAPGLAEHDTLLAVTTVSFDIAAFELLLPLACGARVVLADEAAVIDGRLLHDLIARHGITALQATPATWRMLMASDWKGRTSLRAFCGGEALQAQLAESLSKHVSELWNLYGPTETTVWSAALRVEQAMLRNSPLPIGGPVDSTSLCALNQLSRPQPVGVPGQLFIGGDGLARGYFRNPRLTAEKFVPDPHSTRIGARMYATGDSVHLADDGRFSFLGRIDNQIKIRGFRIEPGDIEAALAQCHGVRDAVVGVREGLTGDPILTAWVMPTSSDLAPATEEMRHFLASRLPDYMLPQAFVAVSAWPLNANGKLDRKLLPAPEASAKPPSQSQTTPPEEILCHLFADLLNQPSFRPEDDFFAFGGHSILALRLANQIKDVFQTDIPIRAIFDASTPRGLAARLKQAEFMVPPVTRCERPSEIPLSSAQARLWFLHQIDGAAASYNISVALNLDGVIDERDLSLALNDLIDRHESLRTLVDDSSPNPVQRILPAGEHCLSLQQEESDEDQIAPRVKALVAMPIAINRELPIRAHLFHLAPNQHVLLLVVHHIAADAWSLGVMAADLSASWSARRQGQQPKFPPLPVQYADYALWQMRHFSEGSTSWVRELQYWQSTLAGLPDEISLPTDRPRPAKTTSRGEKVQLHIAADIHEGLLSLARRMQATLFMVLEAGLAALLHRLGAGSDIPIGVPVSGRNQSAFYGLTGLFVNTLVIRNDLSHDPTFAELVRRVRLTALEAFSNQNLPFDMLLAQLDHSRSAATHPLFQVLLSLQNVPAPHMDIPGVSMSLRPVVTKTAKFDLSINLDETSDADGRPAGIHGELEFRTDLFDRTTAESIVRRYILLLEQAVRDSSLSVSRMPILEASEQYLLLSDQHRAVRAFPPATLVEMLEVQASRTPAAPAVVFRGTVVSYADLHARANRLARLLVAHGVSPEVLCGICMERTVEALVAILAVLKAGGTYVPLDPGYPRARLSLILTSATPHLVLCTRETLSKLPSETNALVLDLMQTQDALAVCSEGNLIESERKRPLLPANAAYLLFTSGSTGQPKGIQVTHASVVNLIHAVIELTELSLESRMLQFASFNFDASVMELFPAWASGACIVLAGSDDRSPERLQNILRDSSVTHLFLTPAVLASMHPGPDLSIQCLMLGGEPCPEVVADRWSAACRAYSVYGPTETTTIVSASDRLHGRETPIGRPLYNTRLYVLNESLQPVPPGVEGELFIAGTGVARGYMGDPRLTALRFLPDPFADESGARMYRSGDAVRRRPDGQLDFLRRLDEQVKIRGNRIELHDIELTIESYPGAHQAAAIAVNGPDGRPALVAYIATHENAAFNTREVHRFLRSRLPEYMVPSAITVLDHLPLGPTGKIDRKRLAQMPLDFFQRESVAPRDEVERVLVEIFAEVLHRENIGVTDSFFEMGGHSLLATQVTSRMRRIFGIEFPLAAFFENGSVESIATHLRSTESSPERTAQISRLYEKVKSLSPEEKAHLLRAKGSLDATQALD